MTCGAREPWSFVCFHVKQYMSARLRVHICALLRSCLEHRMRRRHQFSPYLKRQEKQEEKQRTLAQWRASKKQELQVDFTRAWSELRERAAITQHLHLRFRRSATSYSVAPNRSTYMIR